MMTTETDSGLTVNPFGSRPEKPIKSLKSAEMLIEGGRVSVLIVFQNFQNATQTNLTIQV